jgi:hypothetical protein
MFPSACRSAPVARSAKVDTGFASDRAPNFKLARDLVAKPPTFANHARSTDTPCSLGFREAALTFLNRPGGFRRRRWRRLGGKCGKKGSGKRKRPLRARWRPAREIPPNKPDVLHPASADHHHLSLSRQRPLSSQPPRSVARARNSSSSTIASPSWRPISTKPAAIAIFTVLTRTRW